MKHRARPPRLTCTACNREKSIENFEYGRRQCRGCREKFKTTKWKAAINKSRRQAPWYKRHLQSVRLRQFGLTIEQYEAMLEGQKGRCLICGTTKSSANRLLSVDHDHATGSVRGLLCNNCNTGLGLFQDSVKLLRAATRYLNRFSPPP